jgi:hypothetical protein
MQMTEPFATTVAAVAPVIIVAGSAELAIYGNYLRDWSRQAAVPVLQALGCVGEGSTAGARKESVRRRIRESLRRRWPKALTQFTRATFGLAWSLVMLAQVLAEVLALNWLSTPHAGPDHGLVTGPAAIGALASFISLSIALVCPSS